MNVEEYRLNAPGQQQKEAPAVPRTTPDKVYDIKYWTRDTKREGMLVGGTNKKFKEVTWVDVGPSVQVRERKRIFFFYIFKETSERRKTGRTPTMTTQTNLSYLSFSLFLFPPLSLFSQRLSRLLRNHQLFLPTGLTRLQESLS